MHSYIQCSHYEFIDDFIEKKNNQKSNKRTPVNAKITLIQMIQQDYSSHQLLDFYCKTYKQRLNIQRRFLCQFLFAIKRHGAFTEQIQNKILAYLFSSPYRIDKSYVLTQGKCIVEVRTDYSYCRRWLKQQQTFSALTSQGSRLQMVSQQKSCTLKEQDRFFIGDSINFYENIRISKVWKKPQTSTQKKIITYCKNFKQFIEGNHLKHIDPRYLRREFYIEEHERHIFQSQVKHIRENDVNFCSYEVLDSYLNLVTKNYIELQMGSSDFTREKKFIVVMQGTERSVFGSVKVLYDVDKKSWYFDGQNRVVWKQQQNVNREAQVVRLPNGRIFLFEGHSAKDIIELKDLPASEEN